MSQDAARETLSDPAAGDGSESDPGLFDIDPQWFKIGFFVSLLLWLAYILWETTSYDRFEDTFFPYVVGIPIVLLIVLQLVIIRYPAVVDRFTPEQAGAAETGDDELQQRLEEATERTGRTKREKEKYELVMIGWIIVLPFMMFYIGMGWTLVLYVYAFTWYFVRDHKTAASVTVVVVLFVYVLFIRFLDMIVWVGQFGLADPLELIDSVLDGFL